MVGRGLRRVYEHAVETLKHQSEVDVDRLSQNPSPPDLEPSVTSFLRTPARNFSSLPPRIVWFNILRAFPDLHAQTEGRNVNRTLGRRFGMTPSRFSGIVEVCLVFPTTPHFSSTTLEFKRSFLATFCPKFPPLAISPHRQKRPDYKAGPSHH